MAETITRGDVKIYLSGMKPLDTQKFTVVQVVRKIVRGFEVLVILDLTGNHKVGDTIRVRKQVLKDVAITGGFIPTTLPMALAFGMASARARHWEEMAQHGVSLFESNGKLAIRVTGTDKGIATACVVGVLEALKQHGGDDGSEKEGKGEGTKVH